LQGKVLPGIHLNWSLKNNACCFWQWIYNTAAGKRAALSFTSNYNVVFWQPKAGFS
jgi:hypothetical protein